MVSTRNRTNLRSRLSASPIAEANATNLPDGVVIGQQRQDGSQAHLSQQPRQNGSQARLSQQPPLLEDLGPDGDTKESSEVPPINPPPVNPRPELPPINADQFQSLFRVMQDLAVKMQIQPNGQQQQEKANSPPPKNRERILVEDSDGDSHIPGKADQDKDNQLQQQLKRLNKRLDDMEKEKSSADNDARKIGASPFVKEIQDAPLPPHFKMPAIDTYDGTTDPSDHIHAYTGHMTLLNYPDAILCKAFNITLRKAARAWYQTLKPASIPDFETLKEAFLKQFVATRRSVKHSVQLMNIIQEKDESLRKYFRRFSEEMIEVNDAALDVVIAAIIAGCEHTNFVNSLVENPPLTLADVMKRADTFINAEDTLNGRKRLLQARREEQERPPKRRDEKKDNDRKQSKKDNERKDEFYSARYNNFTVLTHPRSEIFMEIAKEGYLSRGPPPLKSDPDKRNKRKFCNYHKDHGHTTEECRALKDDIEELVRRGYLKKYVKNPHANDKERQQDKSPRANDKESSKPLVVAMINKESDPWRAPEKTRPCYLTEHLELIAVISGGRDIGGRRTYQGDFRLAEEEERRRSAKKGIPLTLSVSEEDLRGLLPQSDSSIVIRAQLDNCDVRRILIDTGSSADILFSEAFERMNIGKEWLKPCYSPLIGFTGHYAPVLGRITLNVTVGDDRRKQATTPVDFLVVNMKSAYNAILGRPFLCAIRAAVIPYCQVIKFPTENGEGRVRSDQEVAKKCYVISTKLGIPCTGGPFTLEEGQPSNKEGTTQDLTKEPDN